GLSRLQGRLMQAGNLVSHGSLTPYNFSLLSLATATLFLSCDLLLPRASFAPTGTTPSYHSLPRRGCAVERQTLAGLRQRSAAEIPVCRIDRRSVATASHAACLVCGLVATC